MKAHEIDKALALRGVAANSCIEIAETAGPDVDPLEVAKALPGIVDALKNMRGAFCTPVSRRREPGDFEEEARASCIAALRAAGLEPGK